MNFKEIALTGRSEQLLDFLSDGSWKRIIGAAGALQRVLSLVLLLAIVSLIYLVTSLERQALDLATLSRIPLPAENSWNWFASENTPQPEFRENKVLPEANIAADLMGVLITSEVATAVIKHAGVPEKVYRKGDRVGSDMIISDIESDRVIIERNGFREQVTLKRPESIFQSTLSPENEKAGPKKGFAIANMFGAVPVSLDGQDGSFNSGFRLNSLSADLRSLADVEDGDVIVEVSGSTVQDLIKNPESWRKFALESNLPVKVIRDGREVMVYVNASSLTQKILPMLGKTDF